MHHHEVAQRVGEVVVLFFGLLAHRAAERIIVPLVPDVAAELLDRARDQILDQPEPPKAEPLVQTVDAADHVVGRGLREDVERLLRELDLPLALRPVNRPRLRLEWPVGIPARQEFAEFVDVVLDRVVPAEVFPDEDEMFLDLEGEHTPEGMIRAGVEPEQHHAGRIDLRPLRNHLAEAHQVRQAVRRAQDLPLDFLILENGPGEGRGSPLRTPAGTTSGPSRPCAARVPRGRSRD